ncbi:DUF1028 domain-containing protein [Mesobacterium sp. TK19101]|uniref:DUF1028 domain-containing protein n=1 Tax=Mesobacterium hydrothermale TaxID=3111907 RepID=A0ABU6HMM7_9RHOB|nr:DUF1028 domain-containing protein [Mesobacterium sp. TK19101]MEC3863367.1 DUF1028 domain-containing protein [Mesobacterium sp. TK19101]
MTFSVLTFDRKTGIYAAGAATGSLCVGGWVLRGDIESGLVASQGTAPSTFWRDDVLRAMYAGDAAPDAVARVTRQDAGRDHRQLTALDGSGTGAGFTGAQSVPYAGHVVFDGLVVAGNMLTSDQVLRAMVDAAQRPWTDPAQRILTVLQQAQAVGGDTRGLLSAALLVLRPDHPPLDLRIDHAENPVGALRTLCEKAHQSPYHDWLDVVPVRDDKTRSPQAAPAVDRPKP